MIATKDTTPVMQSIATPQTATGSSHWHVLLATWLGGVFDGMDSSIFAIILYPSLSELLHTTSHSIVGLHGSYIVALFMVGWAIGAMVFGTVADYFGRAKTLTLTILLYAVCTGLCATAHTWQELGFYRFLVGAGIGGEMGIGAVFLSECWPGASRKKAIGVMATSLGFGYMLTALLNLGLGGFGWRTLFIAGIAPAFLTVYIRSKLKESHQFHESQAERERIKNTDVDQRTDEEKEIAKLTLLTLFNEENRSKLFVVSFLASIAIICWWAVLSWIPAWVNQLTGELAIEQRSHAMFAKDFGMILSGVVGGILVARLGYKICMAGTMLCACATAIGMFMTVKVYSVALLGWIFALGFFAHVPFLVLWMYIPELFNSRVRSTAFGFSYNIGRFAAALAVLGSGAMIQAFNGSYAIAASTVATVYIAGAIACIYMPKSSDQIT